MSARSDILARIRSAHASAPAAELAYAGIERNYRTTPDLVGEPLVERLIDRLEDYKAHVRRCGPDEVAATVAGALDERAVRSIVVPVGLDPAWLAGLDGVDVAIDSGQLPTAELDGVGGVVTACALAVAETGTLVLDASPDQGRRVISLIPDYHLCVVRASQIVADVPQLVSGVDLTRPVTLISGPSATSDIELNRVEGVHGPRTLEVIVVGPDRA